MMLFYVGPVFFNKFVFSIHLCFSNFKTFKLLNDVMVTVAFRLQLCVHGGEVLVVCFAAVDAVVVSWVFVAVRWSFWGVRLQPGVGVVWWSPVSVAMRWSLWWCSGAQCVLQTGL